MGHIFIYSDSASLISFESDCFHGLWTRIYKYAPPSLNYRLPRSLILCDSTPTSKVFQHSQKYWVNSSFEIGSPLMRILSRTSCKCGELRKKVHLSWSHKRVCTCTPIWINVHLVGNSLSVVIHYKAENNFRFTKGFSHLTQWFPQWTSLMSSRYESQAHSRNQIFRIQYTTQVFKHPVNISSVRKLENCFDRKSDNITVATVLTTVNLFTLESRLHAKW